MLNDNELISVYNRVNNGTTGYQIPELNGLVRSFEPGETKKIQMGELRKLDWVPGGHSMLQNFLVMMNEEAVEEILGEVEPEYYYKIDDIKHLLLDGSIDQLEDCLNFAPAGVIDTMKDLAVQMGLNNTDKRKLIEGKTGYDIDRAIRANEEVAEALSREGVETKAEEGVKARKTAEPQTKVDASVPSRKAAAPKYKVVNK